MELSFTQGRWNYERWGGFDAISSNNAKPPGVELWASFDVPQHQVDAYWKNLTHTLSGLFCASINFLESSTTYSSPSWGFRGHPYSDSLRYGTLPREAVCTENLTPWLKLLPCRDKAGLSALLDRPSIYKGFYHSQRLLLSSTEFGSTRLESGIVLEQTLTVVLQPFTQRTTMTYSSEPSQPSWSLNSIFGRKVDGRCVLSKSSNVYLQLERDLVSQLKNLENEKGFELSVIPERVIKEVHVLHNDSSSILYMFSMEKYSESEPFDLGFTWKVPIVWSSPQAPLHASRFLMGSGNERGAIAISLKSAEPNNGNITDTCRLRVDVFQVVPWYVKMYYHTIQLFFDGQPRSINDFIERIRVSPSEDKVSPGVMEAVLNFPCTMKSAALTLEFDKGFLHIDEYPPDANQGFDIPSAVVSFPDFQTSMQFGIDNTSNRSPTLSKLQEKSRVLSYTEVLLVPLTTPDFSMPYNVITLTCTVFALYFGSLLNVLRKRAGEEERFLKRGAKNGLISQLLSKLSAKLRRRPLGSQQSLPPSSPFISSKLLFRVVLVAGIAAIWQYYFS